MTGSDFRKLNDRGLEEFEAYIAGGAVGGPPISLLDDPTTSTPLPSRIFPTEDSFSDRFVFGEYLVGLLSNLDPPQISRDRGLWSALALRWFDQICPPDADGIRKPNKMHRYVLSSDYRHYYRHLVRSPWQVVKDHGANSRFLLLASKEEAYPLSRHGEPLEQLGGRQTVLRSQPLIAEASRLYTDPRTGRPFVGVSGSGRGSARRFALVLRQLDLTFDIGAMANGALLGILPAEFEKWKKKAATT